MTSIENYNKAREWVLAKDSLFELEEVTLGEQALLAYRKAPPTMREAWLFASAYGDRPYLMYGDERWTYAEAARDIAAFAAWLVEQGLKPGDRIAIAMRNYPEWMLAHWAANAVGITVVAMNAWWVADEMAYALRDSEPKLLVADEQRLGVFASIAPDFPAIRCVAVRGDNPELETIPWESARGADPSLPEVQIDPDSDASIFYTSGTTGRPKGAQLTHRSCVANIMNTAAVGRIYATLQALNRAADISEAISPPTVTALIATPLFHVTANNCVVQAGTLAGGAFVLMYKWDPLEALRLIERERVTTLSAVPMMSRELMSHPEFSAFDTSSLISMGGGGAAMQPDLVGKVAAQTKRAKPAQGYGMTEVSGLISYIAGDLFLEFPSSAGPLVPGLQGRCVDAEGNVLGPNEIGEVCVKGMAVIKGYLNRPEASAETIVDGWLHTGDLGYFDEHGLLYLVDRAKDMILRGGENIYGAEVENAVFEHPGVLECVAFAVPDDRLGEEVGLAVHLRDFAMLDAPSLREHLASRLAAFKIPRYIWFLAEPLPRNANGKFLKRELREVLDPSSAD